MPDYRKMYDDKEHFYAFDLEGHERTLEIASVSRGELTGEKNRKTNKPMVSFVGEQKKLALNKTNGKAIAALYGKDTDDWAGKLIAIYPTTTEFGGETVDCIRVRPQRPERSSRGAGVDASKRSSATARQHLVGRYEACVDDAELAVIKGLRGEAWDDISKSDRNAVIAAAIAAKARIDAAKPTSGEASEVGVDEAAEIARLEREAADRG